MPRFVEGRNPFLFVADNTALFLRADTYFDKGFTYIVLKFLAAAGNRAAEFLSTKGVLQLLG